MRRGTVSRGRLLSSPLYSLATLGLSAHARFDRFQNSDRFGPCDFATTKTFDQFAAHVTFIIVSLLGSRASQALRISFNNANA